MEVVLLFGMIIGLLLIGVPIAVSLGLSSIIFLLMFSDSSLASVAQSLYQAMAGHYTLLAIPFFVLASSFMSTGGVAKRIIRFAIACVGHLQGGLAIAGVLACMMFAALSGSSPATVVAIGSIVIAAMVQVGYTKEFAAGVICNAGTLGILIPPSIVMVVYASATDVSVGRMFLAGVFPGLLAGLMLMVTIYVFARIRNMPKGEWLGWGEMSSALIDAFWGLMLIAIIMVGIYGVPGVTGAIFTPTEAAAVASIYAFFVAVFVYRDIGPLKTRPWMNDAERPMLSLGFRVIIFALIGFCLHYMASSSAEGAPYPRSIGMPVAWGWVVLCAVAGWAMFRFDEARGTIGMAMIAVLGALPALIAIWLIVPNVFNGVSASALAATDITAFAWVVGGLIGLIVAALVALFVALPAVIFVFSLNVSSVQARGAGTTYGASLGGAAVSFGKGVGNAVVWFVPSLVHRDTRDTLFDAGKLTITLMFIIANALILKHVLTDEQIPQHIAGVMLDAGFGKIMFLVIVNVILLIGGQFMEPSGLIVIVAPLVFPIAIELGVDPIHLGIIMVVNMEIGMITPPVGLNLFVTSGVAGMPMMAVVRAALPFLMVLFVFLILITYIPIISTYLPTTFMGPEIITN